MRPLGKVQRRSAPRAEAAGLCSRFGRAGGGVFSTAGGLFRRGASHHRRLGVCCRRVYRRRVSSSGAAGGGGGEERLWAHGLSVEDGRLVGRRTARRGSQGKLLDAAVRRARGRVPRPGGDDRARSRGGGRWGGGAINESFSPMHIFRSRAHSERPQRPQVRRRPRRSVAPRPRGDAARRFGRGGVSGAVFRIAFDRRLL
mmetsp:Transcript_16090/g.54265  ORF Transcript_16090/g.54265 Transcript_16090/m.54265 type:complete len:200 (-) Transcript_16090:2497-3096(-)